NRREVCRVDGGAASAAPTNPWGGVRATLAPRARPEPAAGKPVGLQPSPGLGAQP
ncbi:MAG: hypothetical protein RLZZ22_958, partial [Pseudomonadota bacterium]